VTATVLATTIGMMTDTTSQVTSHEGGPGNAASASLTVLGAPIVTVSSPTGGHVYAFGQKVRATFGCVDDPNGPGIGACQGTVPSGSLIDTGKAGAHTFTVTATSLDGGIASDTVFYTVAPDNRFTVRPAPPRRDGSIQLRIEVPGPGAIDAVETIPGRHPLVVGRAKAPARRAGNLRLMIGPNALGRQALQRQRSLHVSLVVGYTPKGGTRRTVRVTFVA
jgi:hypothetical protein